MHTMSCLVLATAALTLAAAPAFADDVTITLNGVEARGGRILATLQSEADFMRPRSDHNAMAPAPSATGPVVLTFRNVPPGAYALSAFHDQNSDGEMQRQPTGMPLEGWAMINAAKLRAAPTFADVSFTVGPAPLALTETMQYSAGQ